jgi:aminoglycoside phosphotransferase (APT) family kinase protein
MPAQIGPTRTLDLVSGPSIMCAPDSPAQIVAILEWEMAALGDPVADLGYLTATYAQKGVTPSLGVSPRRKHHYRLRTGASFARRS